MDYLSAEESDGSAEQEDLPSAEYGNPPVTVQIASPRASGINDKALLALPYIGTLVGVDAAVPSKAIYAIYDPNNPGLRYVQGDGTFRPPEDVCFMERFAGDADSRADLGSAQRRYFLELVKRSAIYYQGLLSPDSDIATRQRIEFPGIRTVVDELMYVSSLRLRRQQGGCPALKIIRQLPMHDNEVLQDQGVPCVLLGRDPEWDFNPQKLSQARLTREDEADVNLKFAEFQETYYCDLSFLDFLQALFCLSGLVGKDMVQFAAADRAGESTGPGQGQNQTADWRARAAAGWTVDCFIARFNEFDQFLDASKFVRVPNPILWLEAELEDELRLSKKGYILRQPWKGKVDGEDVPPVVTWEILRGLKWRGSLNYPVLYAAAELPPLSVRDIVDARSSGKDPAVEAKRKSEDERRNQSAIASHEGSQEDEEHLSQHGIRRTSSHLQRRQSHGGTSTHAQSSQPETRPDVRETRCDTPEFPADEDMIFDTQVQSSQPGIRFDTPEFPSIEDIIFNARKTSAASSGKRGAFEGEDLFSISDDHNNRPGTGHTSSGVAQEQMAAMEVDTPRSNRSSMPSSDLSGTPFVIRKKKKSTSKKRSGSKSREGETSAKRQATGDRSKPDSATRQRQQQQASTSPSPSPLFARTGRRATGMDILASKYNDAEDATQESTVLGHLTEEHTARSIFRKRAPSDAVAGTDSYVKGQFGAINFKSAMQRTNTWGRAAGGTNSAAKDANASKAPPKSLLPRPKSTFSTTREQTPPENDLFLPETIKTEPEPELDMAELFGEEIKKEKFD